MAKNYRGAKDIEKETLMLNDATFTDYYNRLRSLALAMFQWEGLPDSCNARALEKALFNYGCAAFIDDSKFGIINLKVTTNGMMNFYDEPTQYRVFGSNYPEKSIDPKDVVIVRNNTDQLPTDSTIILFARRLYEAETTIRVNIKAQKTPALVRCKESQLQTMKNLYLKVDEGLPVIFGDKDLDADAIKAFSTLAPYIADKCTVYKHDVWNEAYTFLGINNANQDKKERQVVDEVNANNHMVEMAAHVMLMTRQEAIEELNKKWGCSASVKLRSLRVEGNQIVEDEQEAE